MRVFRVRSAHQVSFKMLQALENGGFPRHRHALFFASVMMSLLSLRRRLIGLDRLFSPTLGAIEHKRLIASRASGYNQAGLRPQIAIPE
jgi:hypothetical protein